MKTQSVIALKIFLVMTTLTGIIYPLVMTGIAQIAYPSKSNGSFIIRDGKVIGSELIGQRFDSSVYFWSRPSYIGYNPVPSGASNWGPTSDTLKKLSGIRRETFAKMNSLTDLLSVPTEMIFVSASGIDPHISPEAAVMQVERISAARHFSTGEKEKLSGILNDLTEKPQFLILGQPRINVLILNIELDKIRKNNL
jgi:K+-transporting ATPase ATPase C chain